MNFMLVLTIFLTFHTAYGADSKEIERKKKNWFVVKNYLAKYRPDRPILAAEGEYIMTFNPEVAKWIRQPLTSTLLRKVEKRLKKSLTIPLTERGFARAADRDTKGEKDDTNYNAIWVRDSVWIHYALKSRLESKKDARNLLLALWDYYSTPAQVERFNNILKNPRLTKDPMNMPHIRFNGSSPTLDDVFLKGRPERWNHSQMDAHGIFLLALGEAVQDGLIQPGDMTRRRFTALLRFVPFYKAVNFHLFEDAGAWEEINRRNTSSIALVTRSLQVWNRLLYHPRKSNPKEFALAFKQMASKNSLAKYWSPQELLKLASNGMMTIRRQLKLGGESPDYQPDDIHFRRSDVALMTLMIPSPLEGLTEKDFRHVLDIIEKIKRPYGILRYENDSYQSGNYWIHDPDKKASLGGPTATGDSSKVDDFLKRLRKFIPNSEAQWFFDSKLAIMRAKLSRMTKDRQQKAQDLALAKIHFKRALGQITGEHNGVKLITADGATVKPWLLPESINTIVIDGKRSYLPSPITPLNWAKAGLIMALAEMKRVL